MRSNVVAFVSGALFAVGLAISGMTKPSKVAGFLDLAGAWDASLAFVMVGAIAVHFVAYRLVIRRAAPLFGARFELPAQTRIDGRLLAGAAIFGVGWGLGGFCPGPALVTAGSGSVAALVFVAGMTAAMIVTPNAKASPSVR
ncbi:MAG: YeeE/YedE family protein [Labilithrix sp.]|nr:YeeE/YedE family protein [Labilithrix sp.]